ncbi:hypothetical protein GCM10025771_22070 [Niveibacterium umoris]|uniref:Uncharacterized protein n=2 Tax=Niveibacterium umoris TaxID=1193620 RepID=A0A840BHA9_9RHOO|nr:hypothetical protein [Niveibacterium umoris]MBB4012605.1 hypothetical protein [Niveibacterium umoris]
MPLSPAIAKHLPQKLRTYCEGLRYPHVFLAMIPLFIVTLLGFEHIPYGKDVVTALGLALFISSRLR